ncbi:MAG: peptidoglycan DD-metalloendopeptidase family protein [Steroidobacteraceae bacterium]
MIPRQIPTPPRTARPVAALFGALALLVGPWAPAAQKQPTPAQKEAELRKVNARIEKIQQSVNDDIEQRDRLSAELRSAELGVQAARKTLDEVRAQRLATEARLRELEAEAARLDAQLAAERDALAGELRAAYVNGREEELKLLLNQEDPATFGRMLQYYGYFGRARAERITGIRDKLEQLAVVRGKIAAERDRLAALEADQQKQVAALRGAQDKRTRAVAAIDGEIRSQRGEITRLKSQAAALEKLIADLRRALESGPVAKEAPFEPLRGRLPWPVSDGRVLARFGQPRAGGSLKWQGMLIGTQRGARVRAPFAGRVVYADWLPGMGLMVVLDHGGGYLSLYGHNEELFRKVGDPVAAGDVIGAVGDTGGHDEPALYFEVRRGRQPVNPETWLQKR